MSCRFVSCPSPLPLPPQAQKAKIKSALQKNNAEGARIHCQNAIREKTQALNCLRMASRLDAVASRVTGLCLGKNSFVVA